MKDFRLGWIKSSPPKGSSERRWIGLFLFFFLLLSACLTGGFGFIGDDATDEVRCGAAQSRHQIVQLFLCFVFFVCFDFCLFVCLFQCFSIFFPHDFRPCVFQEPDQDQDQER